MTIQVRHLCEDVCAGTCVGRVRDLIPARTGGNLMVANVNPGHIIAQHRQMEGDLLFAFARASADGTCGTGRTI